MAILFLIPSLSINVYKTSMIVHKSEVNHAMFFKKKKKEKRKKKNLA